LVFTIDGALRPGYSPIREAVSYLLLGPSGWIEIANFIIVSLLLIFFAFGFLQWMRPVITAGWRRVSSALLVLVGVGFIMAALFLPDPFADTLIEPVAGGAVWWAFRAHSPGHCLCLVCDPGHPHAHGSGKKRTPQKLTPQHASFLHSYNYSGGDARSIRLSTSSF